MPDLCGHHSRWASSRLVHQLTETEGEFLRLQRVKSSTSLASDRETNNRSSDTILSFTTWSNINHSKFLDRALSQSPSMLLPRLSVFNRVPIRFIHTSRVSLRDESKAEETLEAIKENMKQKETPPSSTISRAVGAPVSAEEKVAVAVPKKSIKDKIVAELKHYYHGFRLLFIDFRVAARLVWQVVKGKPLTRREQKQVRFFHSVFKFASSCIIIKYCKE